MFGADNGEIHVVDLVAMKDRVIARDAWGPPEAAQDGSLAAYVDKDRRVHLVRPDGTEITTMQVDARPRGVLFSEAGDRVAVLSDTELVIHDATGKRLGNYPIEKDQTVFVLRGDEAWIGGNTGVVRRYKDGLLIASTPALVTELQLGALGRNAIGVIGGDGSLVILRAGAEHVKLDPAACDKPVYTAHGVATSYECDGKIKSYVGRHLIGEYPAGDTEPAIAFDAASKRGAISGSSGTYVYSGGAIVARGARKGPLAFADPDHLYVADRGMTLVRWRFASDTEEELFAVRPRLGTEAAGTDAGAGERPGEVNAIIGVGTAAVLGTDRGELIVIEGRREVRRVPLGHAVAELVVSRDRRWLAAQLGTGATAILDTHTWQVARTLPPGDNYGAATSFDAAGDLLLRTARGAVSIWDRASGEELVYGFDLMRDASNARFLDDGRIETLRREPALIDIPLDTRPTSQILADIACRVPLRVVGSRIEPAVPVACQPGVSGRTLPR
jgi:hypothetical protein